MRVWAEGDGDKGDGEVLTCLQAYAVETQEQSRGSTSDKLRDLHFDVLIALSARSHGARLITSNRADFEAIRRYCKLQLEVW